jgi:hypothetical protein
MEYEVKEYLDMIMEGLENENFFSTCPIAPSLMRKELLKRMEYNLDTRADYRLTDFDVTEVFERCISIHIDESIADALHEGILEIKGVDPNGDILYGLVEPKETQMVSAKFERMGPYGSYCLN